MDRRSDLLEATCLEATYKGAEPELSTRSHESATTRDRRFHTRLLLQVAVGHAPHPNPRIVEAEPLGVVVYHDRTR